VGEEMTEMKPLPDKKELDIMWSVATYYAIENNTRPHIHFAKMLYDELNDIQPLVGLAND
jgi:hypothetical protein